MSTIKVLNMAGSEVGEVELNAGIFGIEPNMHVVHEVVKNHLANCRQGTQSALTRAEVSGGGRKPWRQKGTGHARQGSTRAPQWTHGGIVLSLIHIFHGGGKLGLVLVEGGLIYLALVLQGGDAGQQLVVGHGGVVQVLPCLLYTSRCV